AIFGSDRRAAAAFACWPSTDTYASQVNPDSRGVCSRCSRLVANTSEAVSEATPSVVPKMAERTGTALRPWPGRSAIRIPAAAAGERQAGDSTPESAEGRWPCSLQLRVLIVAVRAGMAA